MIEIILLVNIMHKKPTEVGLVTEEGVEPSRIFIHTIELKTTGFFIIFLIL